MNMARSRARLVGGEIIQVRPHGNSMVPLLKSGQEITIVPLDDEGVSVGDIVFCKVRGRYYVHLVTAIRQEKYQISNNKGHVNGWTSLSNIFGKVER